MSAVMCLNATSHLGSAGTLNPDAMSHAYTRPSSLHEVTNWPSGETANRTLYLYTTAPKNLA
jgi:hypothetical protein